MQILDHVSSVSEHFLAIVFAALFTPLPKCPGAHISVTLKLLPNKLK